MTRQEVGQAMPIQTRCQIRSFQHFLRGIHSGLSIYLSYCCCVFLLKAFIQSMRCANLYKVSDICNGTKPFFAGTHVTTPFSQLHKKCCWICEEAYIQFRVFPRKNVCRSLWPTWHTMEFCSIHFTFHFSI